MHKVGAKVVFKADAVHAIGNCFIDIGGLSGTVKAFTPNFVAIELDTKLYQELLSEWDNCLEFYAEENSWANELAYKVLA